MGGLVISALQPARHGWGEAAASRAARGPDAMFDPHTLSAFDAREWQW